MLGETAEYIVEKIGIDLPCTRCARTARYCRCPEGPSVPLDRIGRILELVRFDEGCELCGEW